jgi:prepilin-type N-terminal cleavage/methylation domain-containing protein
MRISNKQGFTIVELLIVIVVIGILAALVTSQIITSRTQAENTAIISAARSYIKAIHAYQVNTGSLPTMTENDYVVSPIAQNIQASASCIGTGYPAIANDGSRQCTFMHSFNNTFGHIEKINEIATPMNQLQTYTQVKLPNIDVYTGDFTNTTTGVVYRTPTYILISGPNIVIDNDHSRNTYLIYKLEGNNTDCGQPVIRYNTATSGKAFFVSTTRNSGTLYGITDCFTVVPSA